MSGTGNLSIVNAVTQFVNASQATWNSVSVPIPNGMVIYASDTTVLKMGDGITLYANLPALLTLNQLTSLVNSVTGGLNNVAITTPTITGGTADGVVIGATTPASGKFTSLSFTGPLKQSGVTIFYNTGDLTVLGPNAGTAQIAGPAAAQNTLIGSNAGHAMTTGEENTFLGSLAGMYNVTGNQNAGLGCGALWHELTSWNVGVGSDNYRNWVSPPGLGFNTSVGFAALNSGGGYQNTVVGAQSLLGNSTTLVLSGTPTVGDIITLTFTGTFTGSPRTVTYTVPASPTLASVATGLTAAVNADTILGAQYPIGIRIAFGLNTCNVIDTSNIWFGMVGTATTGQTVVITENVVGTTGITVTGGMLGNNNIVLGYEAMYGQYATTASQNIAIGSTTLKYITTGINNLAIGQAAGVNISAGNGNVLLGTSAGNLLTTPLNCIAIGMNALASAITPSNGQVAVGFSAMQYFIGTTGATNTAVGNVAMQGNSAGYSVTGCTVIGSLAGAVFQTGASNSTLVGYTAGQSITTGGNNTAIGAFSGGALTTGIDNTLVGYQSGGGLVSTNSCTMLGFQAGATVTGGSNTIIGAGVASSVLTTGTNNILIGTSGVVTTAAAATSNTINIGNIFTATGINAPATAIVSIAGLVASSTTTGITANPGGGQASATGLTTGYNNVSTVATVADSVRLPPSAVGVDVTITNSSSNALQAFGHFTDTINGTATGVGVSIPAGKTATYWCPVAGTWFGGYLN